MQYSPLLHWVLAAKWANYRYFDFLELDGSQQSFLVGAYETSNQIEAVVTEAQRRKAEREAKSKGRSTTPRRKR